VKDRRAASKIPARVDGYHVEVEVTGTFQRR